MTPSMPDPLAQEADALEAMEQRSAVRIRARAFVGLEEIKAELGRESKIHSAVRLIKQLLDYQRVQAKIIGEQQARIEALEAERDLYRLHAIAGLSWGAPAFNDPLTPAEIAARVAERRRG